MPAARALRAAVRGIAGRGVPRGIALLEVLVALLVLSVGVFGAMASGRTAMHSSRDYALRTLAIHRAGDLVARMQANPGAARSGDYAAARPYADVDIAPPASPCTSAPPCSTALLAQVDVAGWNALNAALLPGGRGAISGDATGYTITVMWRDASLGAAGRADPACAVKDPPEQLTGIACLNVGVAP
jgi:type IV pilus assembly protein PilV